MKESRTKFALYAALLANAAIAVTKFGAGLFTGSAAMLAEGVHSTVDTGNELLLLYGMRRAQRTATPQHPFGYGREIYFWAFVVAIVIFALGGCVSVIEGVYSLVHGRPTSDAAVDYALLGLALVFESASWIVAFRAFRSQAPAGRYWRAIHRSKDPTNFSVLLEDTAAIVGILIAFAGIFLGEWLRSSTPDAAASVAIGLLLACVAGILAYECKGLLIGESALPEALERVRHLIAADPRIEGPARLASMHLGPADVLLAIDADFANSLSAAEIEQAVADLEARIRRECPEMNHIMIEARNLTSAASA